MPTNLSTKTEAERLVLYRDIAIAVANYVSADEIMERFDLTDAQLKSIQKKPDFVKALTDAQRKKEDEALASGIITQEHILKQSAESLSTLVTIRDLHTPGKDVSGIPDHERPAKKDAWLASRISQDLLSRAGFGQVTRQEQELTIRIDRETAGKLVEALSEKTEAAQIIDITRQEIRDGKHNSKMLSLQAAKQEESHGEEGAEHHR